MAMASASTTINNTTLENLVKCGICLDYYNDPRCLPCSHTFCYQCIDKLCEDGIGQCPMRDNSIIFRHTIDKLPVNRIAKDLVECLNKSSSSEIKCDYCKKILSEFICETCSKNYCTICLKLQHNINQFKTHQINIIINNNLNHFCPEHLEEKQKYWCNQCQQIVCSDCLLFKHNKHSFTTLQSIVQKTKTELHLSIKNLLSMKQNLEKLNSKTIEASHVHYQTHTNTINHIEQIINNLKSILEERKKYLIKIITEKDNDQQLIIKQHKYYIEEHLKMILIRELFIKQLLNIEDHFQLIKMKNDFISYNQLIEQQYQQLIQGTIFHLQHFITDNYLLNIQQQIDHLGGILTETCFINIDHLNPLLNLSQLSDHDKFIQLQGNYAYGYRFSLTSPLKFNAIRIKAALFGMDLNIYILDHNDILIQKEIFETNEKDSMTLKWINIPINCEIQHNYYIFVWTQSNEKSIPLITYQDSTYNLRQINEHVSIRSKRAQIDKSTNININTKFNVIYDAFLNDDEQNQTTIPAIHMTLDI